MRRALVVILLVASGCAPVRLRIPEGEDYIFPTLRQGELSRDEAQSAEEAFKDVLSGEGERAEKTYLRLLSRRPDSVPLLAGLAYARLREGKVVEAERSFEKSLLLRGDYLPALVGAASTAHRKGDLEAALGYYRRALEAAPEDVLAKKRFGESKILVTERSVSEARQKEKEGDETGAVRAYRRALAAAPELGEVRCELADLVAKGGDRRSAVELLDEDPSRDRSVLIKLADLLTEEHQFERAIDTYRELLLKDPKDADALARAAELQKTLEAEGMPEEYRKIPESPRISRGELAALFAVKVRPLTRLKGVEPPVAVDISGSWARDHIIRLLSLNIMDLYSNHTFQPGALVRRGDLAEAVARVLDLLRYPKGSGPQATDISSNNTLFEGVRRTLAAGLMDLSPSGAFEAWRPVSGREASDVVDGLVRIVGP